MLAEMARVTSTTPSILIGDGFLGIQGVQRSVLLWIQCRLNLSIEFGLRIFNLENKNAILSGR